MNALEREASSLAAAAVPPGETIHDAALIGYAIPEHGYMMNAAFQRLCSAYFELFWVFSCLSKSAQCKNVLIGNVKVEFLRGFFETMAKYNFKLNIVAHQRYPGLHTIFY